LPQDLFWTNFTNLDWAIVIVYCLLSIGVGIYANRYVGNLADFIVAGRGLNVWIGLVTMTGTEIGLVTLMYQAEWGYTNGFAGYYTGVVWGIALLVIGTSGFIIHKLREMRCMTIPEFYARRYSRPTRILGGCLLAFSGILNMGLFLQAGAVFVTVCTGIPEAGGGLKWVMTGMLALVLFYTILGGMISVVITDLAQFIVLGFGILIATVFAVTHMGWGTMTQTVFSQYGSAGFNPFERGAMGPIEVVWQTFVAFAACALWETATLRALASSSPKAAKKMYQGSAITFAGRFILPATWGIAALAYVHSNPALASAFEGDGMALRAMPLFLAQKVPTGLLGILAAGMFAAFMSTHDSYLIAWSAVLTQDVIAPIRSSELVHRFRLRRHRLWNRLRRVLGRQQKPPPEPRAELGDRARIWLTRGIILAIGVFLLVFGLWYQAPTQLWSYMAVTGSIYFAGAFIAIVGGMYWRRASSMGANFALVAGLFSILGLVKWSDPNLSAHVWAQKWLGMEQGLTWVNEAKIGLCTLTLAAVGMIVGSLLFPDKEKRTDGLVHVPVQDEAAADDGQPDSQEEAS
jgi:SSS family solute:Na+ symporter